MKLLLDSTMGSKSVEMFMRRGESFEPFDPSKHTPKDVGLGGPSTEYLITENAPDGGFWNIPSIWWDKKGNPTHIKDREQALALARHYEETTGKRFPRYGTPGAGSFAAMNRSAMGGASQGGLARYGSEQWKR